MTGVPMTAPPAVRETIVSMTPGAEVFVLAEDRLAVMFPNFSVTIRGAEHVARSAAVLDAVGEGGHQDELVAQIVESGTLPEDRARTTLAELVELGVLCEHAPEVDLSDPLTAYYVYSEPDPAAILALLAQAPVALCAPASAAADIGEAMSRAGIAGEVLPVETGAEMPQVSSELRELIEATSPELIACWGFSYRSPLALELNALAIEYRKRALFGTVEGAIARIGPLVIPGNTACLVCAESRILSNAGPDEVDIAAAFGRRYAGRVVADGPAHPLFAEAASRLFLLELTSVLTHYGARTVNGFVELDTSGADRRFHRVLRVPRCPGCSREAPPRIPWDLTFEPPRRTT